MLVPNLRPSLRDLKRETPVAPSHQRDLEREVPSAISRTAPDHLRLPHTTNVE